MDDLPSFFGESEDFSSNEADSSTHHAGQQDLVQNDIVNPVRNVRVDFVQRRNASAQSESLEEWRDDVPLSDGSSYGMLWMIRSFDQNEV